MIMNTESQSKLNWFIGVFIGLILVFNVVDFVQSFYYLNTFGFEYETNESITNNKELLLVKISVFLYILIWLISIFLIDKFDLRGGTFVKVMILISTLTCTLFFFYIIVNNQIYINKAVGLW